MENNMISYIKSFPPFQIVENIQQCSVVLPKALAFPRPKLRSYILENTTISCLYVLSPWVRGAFTQKFSSHSHQFLATHQRIIWISHLACVALDIDWNSCSTLQQPTELSPIAASINQTFTLLTRKYKRKKIMLKVFHQIDNNQIFHIFTVK